LNKYEKLAALTIILLAIIIASVAVYDFATSQPQNITATNSFPHEPVVDVIIPALFRQTSTGGVNAPLNMTTGESTKLIVQVYPTVNVNVTMQFRYFSLSNDASGVQNSTITGTFDPSKLDIQSGKVGNTTLALGVSQSAQDGEYNAVISAIDTQNSSEAWGVIVSVNVG
jgi:hypothetical protein